MIRIEINRKNKELFVKEPSEVSSLSNGYYGYMEKGIIRLTIEEALYIMDIRNGKCFDTFGNTFTFNDLILEFIEKPKLLARYLTYKDWRDKGLILRDMTEAQGNYGRHAKKKYKTQKLKMDGYSMVAVFFPDDLLSLIDDAITGKELYERYWIGQFGTYKAAHRGAISKLDVYETLFLIKHAGLKLKNSTFEEVWKAADERIKYFEDMYAVYEDWRLRGYVLKTGFKFGTHFRIYLPGASPVREGDEWMHSKHVVHIFSRKSKMIISEWARAIRVAHSVKKTFILGIPGKKTEIKVDPKKPRLDFLLYHRLKGGIENPKEGKPRFLMYSLTEDENIGGEELAKALAECKHFGLEMVMAISDRESSVTYYAIKAIELPGTEYEYFEIEWVQP
ncbi:MAG: tRNA-intron lyase [Candidatus Micrarchaeota archaeon]